MANQIVSFSQPALIIANRVFTDLTNLIILHGSSSGAANGISTLRKPNDSAGYQVPVGKTFYVKAVQIDVGVVAAALAAFGYSDTDLGVEVNTAPTNPVYVGGSASIARIGLAVLGLKEIPANFSVPAGKYLFHNNSASAAVMSVKIFGYEV